MNEFQRREKMAERYRETHPPGTRILLINMDDPHHPVPPGTRGTIVHIDDQCGIHMKWDNGRTLAVDPEYDTFRTLTAEELAEEQRLKDQNIVPFGDDCKIIIPKEPIDCSTLGYFDELEYDCWDLVKKYCDKLGIKIESRDISFDIAKGIQDHIIEQFEGAGVQFKFTDLDEDTVPTLRM